MHVLLVDAYDSDHGDAHVADATAAAIADNGYTIERLRLHDLGFIEPMSADERRVYESDSPLLTETARDSAAALTKAGALVFCYPSELFGVPPVLKSWLERVLVLDVAFTFDDAGRIRPAMTNIKRLAAITTTPHSKSATRSARDLGRRTIMWTLRLNCHRFCRRTFVRLDAGINAGSARKTIDRSLTRW